MSQAFIRRVSVFRSFPLLLWKTTRFFLLLDVSPALTICTISTSFLHPWSLDSENLSLVFPSRNLQLLMQTRGTATTPHGLQIMSKAVPLVRICGGLHHQQAKNIQNGRNLISCLFWSYRFFKKDMPCQKHTPDSIPPHKQASTLN